MPWISNHKHKVKEKSTKSSRSSSKVVGLKPMDLLQFPTLYTYYKIPTQLFSERLLQYVIWYNGYEVLANARY